MYYENIDQGTHIQAAWKIGGDRSTREGAREMSGQQRTRSSAALSGILGVCARLLEWCCQVAHCHSAWVEGASGNDRIGIFQWKFVIGSEIAQVCDELIVIWERIVLVAV
jgi:hypothetical protein